MYILRLHQRMLSTLCELVAILLQRKTTERQFRSLKILICFLSFYASHNRTRELQLVRK